MGDKFRQAVAFMRNSNAVALKPSALSALDAIVAQAKRKPPSPSKPSADKPADKSMREIYQEMLNRIESCSRALDVFEEDKIREEQLMDDLRRSLEGCEDLVHAVGAKHEEMAAAEGGLGRREGSPARDGLDALLREVEGSMDQSTFSLVQDFVAAMSARATQRQRDLSDLFVTSLQSTKGGGGADGWQR
jgi:hypothetical protein